VAHGALRLGHTLRDELEEMRLSGGVRVVVRRRGRAIHGRRAWGSRCWLLIGQRRKLTEAGDAVSS
jgi:hypothetical protein